MEYMNIANMMFFVVLYSGKMNFSSFFEIENQTKKESIYPK